MTYKGNFQTLVDDYSARPESVSNLFQFVSQHLPSGEFVKTNKQEKKKKGLLANHPSST